MLKICLLGAPQLFLDGVPVTGFVTRKAEALFYYLAVTGRAHTRDTLSLLFWSERNDSRAKKNLRDLLFNLRQILGDYLIITRTTVAFAQDRPYWLDVEELRTQLKQVTPTAGLHTLLSAVALYQGEFLEGFSIREADVFEEWMLVERKQLYELYVQALLLLIDSYLAAKEYNLALSFTQKLLALQPWHELAHRQQMLCLAYMGRWQEALAQYELCRQRLIAELAVSPSAETADLYEQLRAGKLPVLEPAAATLPGVMARPTPPVALHQTLHNLPRQLTPFFGRTIEITQLTTKLLQPDCAWLTLVGEGGIGKTRLAIKVAREVLPYFRDGVWLISLADIRQGPDVGEQLATLVAQSMQLALARTEVVLPQLIRLLRDRQLLLILDNFEQIGQAGAAFIHQLLQATLQVKVMVITRHRLNYQAENLFMVDLLPVPDEEEALTLPPEKLLNYAAIALFVHRAAQIRFDFVLTEDNAAAVLQICRVAQGLPLAIELAATLIQHHSVAGIADQLTQSIHALQADFHDLPPRHHSLQATLSYSWEFLPLAESMLLAQCTIFVGGFTAEAAAAVIGSNPVQLQQWESQALLQSVAANRYEMHALMRQYGLTQLQQMPDIEADARRRHAFYFFELLQKAYAAATDNARTIDALNKELANICRAWEWLLECGDYTFLLTMLPKMAWLFTSSGSHQTAVGLFHRSLDLLRPPAVEPTLLFANLLLEQAYFYIFTAHLEEASPLIQEALALTVVRDDLSVKMTAYWRLGDLAWAQGDYAGHRSAYEQAYALAQQIGRPQGEVHCLSNLGMSFDLRGEYSSAIRCYEEALRLAQQVGDIATVNVIYNNLGVSNILFEDFSRALHYYNASLELSRRLGDQEGSGFANLNFGLLYNSLGAWSQARWHGERALKIFRLIGDRRLEARALVQLGLTLLVTGEVATASSYCQQALHIAHAHGYQAVAAEALMVWGQLLVKRQQFVPATGVYREASTLWHKLGRTQRALVAQGALADALRRSGDLAAALSEVEEILAVTIVIDESATMRLAAAQHETKGSTPTVAGQVLLACYETLTTCADPRAPALLRCAQQLLRAKAAQISDEKLRTSFLAEIEANRTLLSIDQTIVIG